MVFINTLRKNTFLIFFLTNALLLNAKSLKVNSISFLGNKITKEKILLAEIQFNTGDSVSLEGIEVFLKNNAEKIYNLQLFHFVDYKYEIIENQIDITFVMQERWYIWPIPIFSLADRNLNAWINKADINRIDYGLHTAWYNFRGRNETVITNFQHGFNRKYELFYSSPQVNKKQDIGINFGVSFYQSHYLDYQNIKAKPITLRLEEQFPVNRKYIRVGLSKRKTASNIGEINIELNQQVVRDTILELNNNYQLTGNQKTYLQFEVSKILNKRNNFSYPTAGSYLQINVKQRFFIEKQEGTSSRLQLFYSKYIPINKKYFYGIGSFNQYKLVNKISSSENIALGYRQNLRGFDYYIIDGQHFTMLKQNFNALLLKEKAINLKFIPSKKFNTIPITIYYGIFTDVGYVYDNKYEKYNPLSNQFIYSIGSGLHFVSYYDQVLVLEYTLNSKKEHGIFINTKFSF